MLVSVASGVSAVVLVTAVVAGAVVKLKLLSPMLAISAHNVVHVIATRSDGSFNSA